GKEILDNHCHFDNENGVVTLHPSPESKTLVNGMRINRPKKLKSEFYITLGNFHVFRFSNPEDVRSERKPSLQINSYTIREMALNYLNYTGGPVLSSLSDEDPQRRMDDLRKIQNAKKVCSDSLSDNFDDTASEKTEEKVRVIKEKMQRELDLQKQQYEEKIKL
ncbi:8613_t:CDS:2, partial [Racocetra fulgida]